MSEEPILDAELAEWQRISDEATPAPWIRPQLGDFGRDGNGQSFLQTNYLFNPLIQISIRHSQNAAFFEMSRVAVPSLLTEVKRLKKKYYYAELSDAAHVAVRRVLEENDVPSAPFIDDHVGNAIWQRNEARKRGDRYRNRALVLIKALREEREVSEYLDDIYHQAEDDFTNTVERLAIAEPSLAVATATSERLAALLLPLLKEKLEEEWEQGNIGEYEYDDGGDWEWEKTWDWIHNTDLPQFDDTVDSVEPTNAWVVAYRAVRDAALTPQPASAAVGGGGSAGMEGAE